MSNYDLSNLFHLVGAVVLVVGACLWVTGSYYHRQSLKDIREGRLTYNSSTGWVELKK